DKSNCRIRRVDANTHLISTVAGSGACGFGGDGGSATLAKLNGPGRIIFDSLGRLYITEHFAPRVRRVDFSVQPPTISTVAGTGIPGSSGDGGPSTSAALNKPSGIGSRSDQTGAFFVFISDSGAGNVRRIDSAGIIQTSIGGSNGDGWPADVAKIDPQGMRW